MKLIKNICMIGVAATLLSGCRGDLMDLNPYSSISSVVLNVPSVSHSHPIH